MGSHQANAQINILGLKNFKSGRNTDLRLLLRTSDATGAELITNHQSISTSPQTNTARSCFSRPSGMLKLRGKGKLERVLLAITNGSKLARDFI